MTSESATRTEPVVTAVYQPIVELQTMSVVGYEALARWTSTRDTVGLDVDDRTRLSSIDWACREAAIGGALDAGLDHEALLFVNVEPRVLGREAPEHARALLDRAERELQLVVELTERDLLASPGELLAFAERVRARGWGLALDDVGVHTESLAALPFLEPDVVKLDISLVQHDPTTDQARTLTGVLAHSERVGTALLAEGIETEAHLERAQTLGAVLGQGYLFGRPGPLPITRSTHRPPPPLLREQHRHRAATDDHPGAILARSPSTRVARRPVLEKLSRQLEQHGLNQADPAVLLATFQHVKLLNGPTAERYATLARVCRFVGVLGQEMPGEPLPGVRGAAVEADDPLTSEWNVVVVGAHYAGALIARALDDNDPDLDASEHRFAFVLTHDRDTVIDAGRHLLRRFEGPRV